MATSRKGFSTKTLDKLWSKKVKELAGNRCEICFVTGVKLNAHHIQGRKNYNVRWNLDNGVCLCNDCHQKGNRSAHKNPLYFMWLIMQRRGDNWRVRLIHDTMSTDWKDRLPEIKKQLQE